jgi:hypothetical protein
MDLIDRYVHEVGRNLPGGLRADVEAELRSLLGESLEERSRAAGRPPDEALAADVLREFGRPRDVAERYAPEPRYLIGPGLFPVYIRVLKIMVPAFAVVALVLLALGAYREPGHQPTLGVLLRAMESFLSGTFFNLGLVTLVFALVERSVQRRERATVAWDPSRLPPADDPDRISYFGRIFALYLMAAVAIVFNFFPDWVGVVMINDSEVRVVRLLEPEFSRYLPLIDAWWAVAFVLGLVVLREGRWTRATRWVEFALELANATILAIILVGPPVFRYDALVKLALPWFLLVVLIRAGVQFYRLLTRRAAEPWRDAPAG